METYLRVLYFSLITHLVDIHFSVDIYLLKDI